MTIEVRCPCAEGADETETDQAGIIHAAGCLPEGY